MKHTLYCVFLIFTFFTAKAVSAQNDSVQMVVYTSDYQFIDGVYLSFSNLKQNSPISKARIISSEDFNSPSFFETILAEKTLQYYDSFGMMKEVNVKQIWGYCDKGKIFVNWNDAFNRIPYLGNASHFVANKTVYQNNYNSPYYGGNVYNPYSTDGMYNTTPSTVEMVQYILDMETGQIYDFSVSSVEILLMRTPELYEEFNSLRNRKKKQLMFLYLRKYNEKYPLYLPVDN